MAIIQDEPLQVPADSTHAPPSSSPDGKTVTQAVTLPRKTQTGGTGTATYVNGKLSTFTKPT
jgi:hypothetical protein